MATMIARSVRPAPPAPTRALDDDSCVAPLVLALHLGNQHLRGATTAVTDRAARDLRPPAPPTPAPRGAHVNRSNP